MNGSNDFIKPLKTKFPSAFLLSDNPRPVAAISTGSYALDHALGIGGFPKGRMTEIFGPDGSGKTTLVYSALAQAQKHKPFWTSFLDSEHRFDPLYAQAIGLDEEKLVILQPENAEQGMAFVEACLQSGGFSAVAVDSVAGLAPKAEIEGDIGDMTIGLKARLMSHLLRKISGPLRQSQAVLLFTNQLRMKIGVMWGNPETTPGGKALKFHASVRLRLSSTTPMAQAGSSGRSTIKAVIHKNSCAPPYKRAEFDIVFGEGIDRATDLLAFLKATSEVEVKGAYYFQGTNNLGHREDVLTMLRGEPAKWDAIAREKFAQIGEEE